MTTFAALRWRTSSRSGTNGGECVQVAFDDGRVLIRDSKYLRDPANDPELQPIVEVPAEHWDTFLQRAVRRDTTVPEGLPAITHLSSGEVAISHSGTVLTFTAAEWTAFTLGVRDGEFAAA